MLFKRASEQKTEYPSFDEHFAGISKKKLIVFSIIVLILIVFGFSMMLFMPLILSADDLDMEIKNGLIIHNIYRRKHGVEDLEIDKKLNENAQKWADYLAFNDKFEHSKTEGKYGENLAFSCHSNKDMLNLRNSTGDATQRWYDEIKDYNYNNPLVYENPIGHFTQVVWKGSKKLGIGVTTVERKKMFCVYVVAHYVPAGNMHTVEAHRKNVPRLL